MTKEILENPVYNFSKIAMKVLDGKIENGNFLDKNGNKISEMMNLRKMDDSQIPEILKEFGVLGVYNGIYYGGNVPEEYLNIASLHENFCPNGNPKSIFPECSCIETTKFELEAAKKKFPNKEEFAKYIEWRINSYSKLIDYFNESEQTDDIKKKIIAIKKNLDYLVNIKVSNFINETNSICGSIGI